MKPNSSFIMKHFYLLFRVLALLVLPSILLAQTKTVSIQINASSDDAEERGANASSGTGTMDLTSSDIELVADGNDGDQYIGLRFSNVAIPQGAYIANAYIQFVVDEDDASPGTVVFRVEDTDDASTFTGTDFNISSRATLTDSVLWDTIPVWPTVGANGDDQKTADLSKLVQAIVNRKGWVSGNALNFIATGTGERVAESYDGVASSAPTLVVEYIEPVTTTFSLQSDDDDAENDLGNGGMDLGSSDLELTTDGSSLQLIGLRFADVKIPAGSQILEAYVQFTVDEVNTGGQVDVLFSMEEADNAAAIASGANNLASRDYLDESVIWNSIPSWTNVGDAGADQRSPNLSILMQEVIGRDGWAAGNAVLVGMIDPAVLSIPSYTGNTSKRVAQSRDKSTSAAPKLIVSYIPPSSYQLGKFPIPKYSSWKYDDSGTDRVLENWTDSNYNDSDWAFGNGVLGYGNGNEESPLDFGTDASSKHTTTYLRHIFMVDDASIYDSLVFKVLRDDGAVVYVNGKEAFRQNMPMGTISYNTFASSAAVGASETNYFINKTENLLVTGKNVIAVELHQSSLSSSDLSFDMEVDFELPPLAATTFPLSKGTKWHYLDDGKSLDGVNWKTGSYSDDNWDFGAGPLGYGDPTNTEISYGDDANNKHVTYYFRRDITIDTASMPDSVQVGLRRDDGAIVYINGVEIIRDNLPTGTVTSSTLALSTVSGADEAKYFSTLASKNIFKNGLNVIAVEVHNRDVFSSDLIFDMFIDELPEINPPALGCKNGNKAHIGCFTSIAPTSQTTNLIIPEGSHKFQMLFQQNDAYTISSGTVPGNHDFTGYVPINGSSTLGHLAINHENTPGGVSVLDLHYNDSSKTWLLDSSQAVDFYNTDLVTTTRNCSGGITPWGTIITAEESRNTGDVNNDGYTDVGWLVEIDPVSAKVKSYGNGKQEKLWATGRYSHENAVVLNDSLTLYSGEDGGSSAVFKFVADQKMNLSKGTLYALQLDAPLSGGDPTGTTGKWIAIPNTTQADQNNTSSLAISLGATNFSGVEDIEVSPVDHKMYFTSKGNGRVYRFSDDGSSVSKFETFVGGTDYILNTKDGIFTESWGGGNDNLTFDDQGNLWVLQDGGYNYIWVVRPDHTQSKPKVELFASAPIGSEPTGLTFSPDYRFAFVSIQHPSNANLVQKDATLSDVNFNRSSTIVFARGEHLGPQRPVAGFESNKRIVVKGESVVFSDTSSAYPTSRNWVFNGGVPATSNKVSETVVYNGLGTYTVELVVANAQGADTAKVLQYIEVIEPAPVVDFYANKTFVRVNEEVSFTSIAFNNPTSYNWTFNGANIATSSDANPKVTYALEGSYAVSLSATNQAGTSPVVQKTAYIEVANPVGITDLSTNDLAIYPNPSTGFVTVEMTTEAGENISIEAFNMVGMKLGTVSTGSNETTSGKWNLDLSQYAKSTQSIMLVITVDHQVTRRVIHFIH